MGSLCNSPHGCSLQLSSACIPSPRFPAGTDPCMLPTHHTIRLWQTEAFRTSSPLLLLGGKASRLPITHTSLSQEDAGVGCPPWEEPTLALPYITPKSEGSAQATQSPTHQHLQPHRKVCVERVDPSGVHPNGVRWFRRRAVPPVGPPQPVSTAGGALSRARRGRRCANGAAKLCAPPRHRGTGVGGRGGITAARRGGAERGF